LVNNVLCFYSFAGRYISKKKEIDKTGNLNVGEGNISLNIGMQEVLASVFLICKRHFLEKNLVEL
jgi:hypothetical protein